VVGPVGGAAPRDIAQRLRGHERRRHLLSLLCLSGRCCLVCLVFFGGLGVRGCVGTRIARFRLIRSVSMGFDRQWCWSEPVRSIRSTPQCVESERCSPRTKITTAEARGRGGGIGHCGREACLFGGTAAVVCQSVCCTRTSPCIAEGTHTTNGSTNGSNCQATDAQPNSNARRQPPLVSIGILASQSCEVLAKAIGSCGVLAGGRRLPSSHRSIQIIDPSRKSTAHAAAASLASYRTRCNIICLVKHQQKEEAMSSQKSINSSIGYGIQLCSNGKH